MLDFDFEVELGVDGVSGGRVVVAGFEVPAWIFVLMMSRGFPTRMPIAPET